MANHLGIRLINNINGLLAIEKDNYKKDINYDILIEK